MNSHPYNPYLRIWKSKLNFSHQQCSTTSSIVNLNYEIIRCVKNKIHQCVLRTAELFTYKRNWYSTFHILCLDLQRYTRYKILMTLQRKCVNQQRKNWRRIFMTWIMQFSMKFRLQLNNFDYDYFIWFYNLFSAN